VVKAEFAAQRVEKVLLNLRLEDGGLPPFGAQVVDGAQRTVGVVGPGGQALLAFEGDVGALTVRWGANASQQCRALLALAGEAPAQGYRQVQSVCRQGEVALVSITPQVADEERDSGTE
jgi:outer membrane usher protein